MGSSVLRLREPSLGRSSCFLPASEGTRTRWMRVDRAFRSGRELPPVSLYRAGDLYFVEDGNHRVSVAAYHGVEWVDAVVTEFRVRRPDDPEAPQGGASGVERT